MVCYPKYSTEDSMWRRMAVATVALLMSVSCSICFCQEYTDVKYMSSVVLGPVGTRKAVVTMDYLAAIRSDRNSTTRTFMRIYVTHNGLRDDELSVRLLIEGDTVDVAKYEWVLKDYGRKKVSTAYIELWPVTIKSFANAENAAILLGGHKNFFTYLDRQKLRDFIGDLVSRNPR